MISDHDIELVRHAAHGDPFSVLGPHADAQGGLWLRAMLPHASQVTALDAGNGAQIGVLAMRHADGLFEGLLTVSEAPNYRLQIRWADGRSSIVDDAYRFPPVLGDLDVWLLGEGTHLRPFEALGAAQRVMLGAPGTSFAVWAPNASQVSVVGDFNHWDARRRRRRG
jgi:1,4-alpha-glucan branching enzyme